MNDDTQSAAMRSRESRIAENRKRAKELRECVANLIDAQQQSELLLQAEELEKEADRWEKELAGKKKEILLTDT